MVTFAEDENVMHTTDNTFKYFKDDKEGNQLGNTYFKTLQRVYSNLIMGSHLLWVKKY